MVLGVAGVLVTTLGFEFGGSWVFLYPLSFHGAGQWGRLDDRSSSRLGAARRALDRHVVPFDPAHRPRAGAARGQDGSPNRLGVALGFGYLWPKRFATNPRPVPYAVIPLTVIALDMIIATLPLAVLLVEMIVQSLSPSVQSTRCSRRTSSGCSATRSSTCCSSRLSRSTTCSSRARRPAARRRQRDRHRLGDRRGRERHRLGAPHLHRLSRGLAAGGDQHGDAAADVRARDPVGALALQPGLHDLPLDWRWTAPRRRSSSASSAGCSPASRASSTRRSSGTQVVHNTLWIVGHFHHMALLNIGLVIFGAIYSFLPELTGHEL